MNNLLYPISIEAEVTDNFSVIVIDKGLMTRIEEDILLPQPNPEDIILKEIPLTRNIGHGD